MSRLGGHQQGLRGEVLKSRKAKLIAKKKSKMQ